MISVSVRGTAAGEAVIIRHYTRTPRSIVTRVAACSSSGWGAPLAPDSPTEGRTAIGASCPFPWVLANVPSPNPQQPFAACNGTGAPRPALIDLLPGDHEKEKYELKKVGRGIANTLKPEAQGAEPPQFICALCYEDGKRSIMQNFNPATHLHTNVIAAATLF